MPAIVSRTPNHSMGRSFSPSSAQASKALISGAVLSMSRPRRGPIRTYAWNSMASPIARPMTPDRPSHSQRSGDASNGMGEPSKRVCVISRKITASSRRVRLRTTEPRRRLAMVKNVAEPVQRTAVAREASSPSREDCMAAMSSAGESRRRPRSTKSPAAGGAVHARNARCAGSAIVSDPSESGD